MIAARDILWGVLIPGLAAAGLAFFTAHRIGCVLALAAAYMMGQVAIGGWPGFLPNTTEQWLVWMAVAAAGVECLERRFTCPYLRWGIRSALVAALLGLTLKPLFQHSWSFGQSCAWTVGIAGGLLGLWRLSPGTKSEPQAILPMLAWTLVVFATAAASALGGSLKLGQFAGALAAGLAACSILSLWQTDATLDKGGWGVLLILWGGLLCNSFFYASVPWWAALLIAISPASLALRPFIQTRIGRPWLGAVLSLTIVAVPLLAALIPMAVKFIRAMNAEPGSEYY